MEDTRVCGTCKRTLTLDNYYKCSKDKIYGKGHVCKDCLRVITRKWTRDNKDKVKASNKKRYDAGKKNRKAGTRFCLVCGTDLVGKSYHQVYCGLTCFNAALNKDNRIQVNCAFCGQSVELPKSRKHRSDTDKEVETFYCSTDCQQEYYKSQLVEQICGFCGKRKMVAPSSVREFCNKGCYGKWRKYFLAKEDHPRWLGDDRVDVDRRAREQSNVREWRVAVFKRDNFTCQDCGVIGGPLEAHHIKRWRDFPELRSALDNGVTLCKKCHRVYTNIELKDVHKRKTTDCQI